MDTNAGLGGICPPYLDTDDAADTWGAPRWGGTRPAITARRAKAIAEKRTWEARGELATWATEAQFATDLAGPLVPEARLVAVLGAAALELGEAGWLVALCLATADWRRRQRGQDGFRAPLPALATRIGRSVRHTARLVDDVVAAFKRAGVGVDTAPDHVRRKAACSRRSNAYALDWGIVTRTKTVRASGTDDPTRACTSAISSSAAATPCRGAAVEIMISPCPDAASASSEQTIDGPTTATAAVGPASADESCEVTGGAPDGPVTGTVRDLLADELDHATGERRVWLQNAIKTLDTEARRLANLTRKGPG